MPLDSHSYLVSQGWGGQGTALRQGAISRPLAVPQKKNLSGIGKDRDEAFPFWDHLFSAAAKSIQVKVFSEDDNDSDSNSVLDANSITTLKRTTTGILSNRRPNTGAPASSGTNTPDPNPISQLSLLATAKREAAKRGLYSRFFRGPVLGPDTDTDITKDASTPTLTSHYESSPSLITANATKDIFRISQKDGHKKKRDYKETGDEKAERKRKRHKAEKDEKLELSHWQEKDSIVKKEKKSRKHKEQTNMMGKETLDSRAKKEERRRRKEERRRRRQLGDDIVAAPTNPKLKSNTIQPFPASTLGEASPPSVSVESPSVDVEGKRKKKKRKKADTSDLFTTARLLIR